MRSLWTRSRESRQHGGRVSVASEVTRNATFPAGYTTQPNKKYWASSISPISNHIEKARQNKILGKTLLPPPPSPKHEEPKECILKTIETIVVPASWTTVPCRKMSVILKWSGKLFIIWLCPPPSSRASLTVRILRYEIEKGLRAVYPRPYSSCWSDIAEVAGVASIHPYIRI